MEVTVSMLIVKAAYRAGGARRPSEENGVQFQSIGTLRVLNNGMLCRKVQSWQIP